jgi:hypothetical protein
MQKVIVLILWDLCNIVDSISFNLGQLGIVMDSVLPEFLYVNCLPEIISTGSFLELIDFIQNFSHLVLSRENMDSYLYYDLGPSLLYLNFYIVNAIFLTEYYGGRKVRFPKCWDHKNMKNKYRSPLASSQ